MVAQSAPNPESYYWGYLIRSDKSATPLFEQLCLGIAKCISKITPSNTDDLTPAKLAAFYRLVGGNYDRFFLCTPPASLSLIYQSLGCFHTLHPTNNAFDPPSIPALLPHGFVRWQTMQLLLCPDEHARFLQEAVKRFEIVNPAGGVFPRTIPRDAFPDRPDPEMVRWHGSVSRRLEQDWRSRSVQQRLSPAQRPSPPRRSSHHSRQSSTSIDDIVMDENGDYFSQVHRRSSRDRRPSRGSRTPSHEAHSPYSHPYKHGVTGNPSPSINGGERKHRHRDELLVSEVSDDLPLRFSGERSSSASRSSIGRRSVTPTGRPLRSHALSDSSFSDEWESISDVRPRHQPRPRDDREYRPRERRSPPRHNNNRRHSHDPSHSQRSRWNESPRRPRYDRHPESSYSPETKRAREFYYSHVHPFTPLRKSPSSSHHYRDDDHPIRSPSPPKSSDDFYEYIAGDSDSAISAPSSPIGLSRFHRKSKGAIGRKNSHSRHLIPDFDPQPLPLPRERRRSSISGGSRRGSSTEGTRLRKGTVKSASALRREADVQDMRGDRYVSPTSPV